MRWLVAAALLLAAVSTASAQTPAPLVARIDVLDKGIYTVSLGFTSVTASLLENTTKIPGKLGLEFGLRYSIAGAPVGADVILDFVNKYPSPGLDDPAEVRPVIETRYTRVKQVGGDFYLGYAFDYVWEVVPGTWSFEIWYQGKKLAEQSFTVTN